MSFLLSEPARKDALLLFVTREGLVRDVTEGGCLDYSVHKMIEFRIFIVKTKKDGRVASLDFMKVLCYSGHYLAECLGICF